MCKCPCNGEECSFRTSGRAPTRFAFINGGQFRWRHLYLKISVRGGGEITNARLQVYDTSIQPAFMRRALPPLLHPRHGGLIEQQLRLSRYVYENKNQNVSEITLLMGRECLLIMQRSVVTVLDKGVRCESNRRCGGWRDASSAGGKVRVDTLWQKGEIRSDNKGK